jgi:hypothetical protein
MEPLADEESGRRAASPAPAALGIGAETATSEPRRCPPEATGQPSTWLECIEDLERAGLVDEAAAERQRLRDAFPGIELP